MAIKGRLFYLPPDVVKEIEKTKMQHKISSPSKAIRLIIKNNKNTLETKTKKYYDKIE